MTGAAKWLELTHDTLADVVRSDRAENQQRRQMGEAERQRALAEEQARLAREREQEAIERLKRMRRERRWIMAFIVSFVALLGVAGYLLQGQLEVGKEMQGRSRIVRWRARASGSRRRTTTGAKSRQCGILRVRCESIQPIGRPPRCSCNLLMEHNWCPPISRAAPLCRHPPPLRAGSVRAMRRSSRSPRTEIWCAGMSSTFEQTSAPLDPNRAGTEGRAVLQFGGAKRRRKTDRGRFLAVGQGERACLDVVGRRRACMCRATWPVTSRTPSVRRCGTATAPLLCLAPMRGDFRPGVCLRRHELRGQGRDRKGNGRGLQPGRPFAGHRGPGWNDLPSGTRKSYRRHPTVPRSRNLCRNTRVLNPVSPCFGSATMAGNWRPLGSVEIARLWDLAAGKSRILKAKSRQDPILRADFAGDGQAGYRVAAGANGMVGIWDANDLGKMSSAPICLDEAFVYPSFNSQGTKLLTISRALLTAMNTVRLWDTSFRKPANEAAHYDFDGRSAPIWLSYLAEAITGVRVNTDEDDSPPPNLAKGPQNLRRQLQLCARTNYQIIWNRFMRGARAETAVIVFLYHWS